VTFQFFHRSNFLLWE